MGWTTEGSEFKSRYGQEFSLLHSPLNIVADLRRTVATAITRDETFVPGKQGLRIPEWEHI
jgi:hypothetical protein